MMWQSPLFLIGIFPALILLAVVKFERRLRKRRGERPPMSEKLLRPAGYSLQCKLEDLSDASSYWILYGVFSAMLAVILPLVSASLYSHLTFLVMFSLFSVGCTFMAWRKLKEMRNYRMGLTGEQAVAEQLQPLCASGYQVFHDVPSDKKWNIDHVAVGPSGVFAIETKYRTKKPGKDGSQDYKATFDGNRIEFASGDYDAKAVGQARDNARWLEKELSKATGECVTVQPIVALPGWWVTLKADSDVKVLSGKQISGYISKESTSLSPRGLDKSAISWSSDAGTWNFNRKCGSCSSFGVPW